LEVQVPNVVPAYDRVGLRRSWQDDEEAIIDPTTANPPNNETICLMNWMRCDLDANVSSDHFVGLFLHRNVTGHAVAMLRNGDAFNMGSYNAAWQYFNVAIPDTNDHLWCVVVDRDNTQLEAWLDGVKVESAALTQDPDLTAALKHTFNNSTAEEYSDITWRGITMTFANGSTPSNANLALAFKGMRDPNYSGLHPILSTAKGSYYSDYSPGEGIYGANTVTDNGDNGDDLTYQGGDTFQVIRTRARTPVRIPQKSYYGLTDNYLATLISVDFGFAVQPVIIRAVMGDCRIRRTGTQETIVFTDTGATDYMRLMTLSGATYVRMRSSGANKTCILDSEQPDGGDLWIICNGTDVDYYWSGVHIFDDTLAAALDLSGTCTITMDGEGGACCRLAAWNPATVPGTLVAEIQECAMNPELDPASLTNKLVDFPIRSDLVAAGGSTIANQGTGGGTLSLSAIRSTSCKEIFVGHDP
jgi:hypothetical protein